MPTRRRQFGLPLPDRVGEPAVVTREQFPKRPRRRPRLRRREHAEKVERDPGILELQLRRFRAEAAVPAQRHPRKARRLAIPDEEAEGERIGERHASQLSSRCPCRRQVPALERTAKDRVWMTLTRQGTYVRLGKPSVNPEPGFRLF